MKKRLTSLLATLAVLLTSATAWACPNCQTPFDDPGCFVFITTMSAVVWLPTAVVTGIALLILRKRFASRTRLVLSLLGSIPMSIASTFLIGGVIGPALADTIVGQGTPAIVAAVGIMAALQAGYVAVCYVFGGGPIRE